MICFLCLSLVAQIVLDYLVSVLCVSLRRLTLYIEINLLLCYMHPCTYVLISIRKKNELKK